MCLCGEDCVVKSFQVPNLINRIAYGLLRKSKAQRSFEYAQRIASLGIGSPEPLAWLTIRKGFLFSKSFYVSRTSECQLTYSDLIGGKFPEQEKYLEAIAHTAARLHEAGIIHRDFREETFSCVRTRREKLSLSLLTSTACASTP